VVTRQDGRLAVGKLGALCEQVAFVYFCVEFFFLFVQGIKIGF